MSWLRKALTHMAMSRSNAALIKASGGTPRTVRGMTLDPRFQYLEDQVRKRPIDWERITPSALRGGYEQLTDLFGGSRVGSVRVERIYISGRSHSAPARLYLPHVRDNGVPMTVYFHSGGGVIGSLETCDRFCSLLAKTSGAPVLSVEYRLGPEHRFPAGLEDAMAAYKWAIDNSARFGAKARRVAVGGDSAGGNFAAVIAQQAKRGAFAAPVLQLLIYPMLDLTDEGPSMKEFADAFPLTDEMAKYLVSNYLPKDADPTDVRISPGRAPDVAGLAPALFYFAGFDILLDQGSAYADRLAAAGVPVTRTLFETLPHNFIAYPAAAPAAETALKRIAVETTEALKKYV